MGRGRLRLGAELTPAPQAAYGHAAHGSPVRTAPDSLETSRASLVRTA